MADDVRATRRSVVDLVRELPPAPGSVDTAPVLTPGAAPGDIVVPPLPADEPRHSLQRAWPTNMHLDLVACHINAPVGRLVTPDDVAAVLRAGSLAAVSEPASSLLAYLFIECSPETIVSCAREAGASLQSVQQLYATTLAAGLPRAIDWENATQEHAGRNPPGSIVRT